METTGSGTVYSGTFIHSVALNNLEILEDHYVGVDEHGIIKFVEPGVSGKLKEKIRSCGWKSWEIYQAPKWRVSFWFPGFIGM